MAGSTLRTGRLPARMNRRSWTRVDEDLSAVLAETLARPDIHIFLYLGPSSINEAGIYKAFDGVLTSETITTLTTARPRDASNCIPAVAISHKPENDEQVEDIIPT